MVNRSNSLFLFNFTREALSFGNNSFCVRVEIKKDNLTLIKRSIERVFEQYKDGENLCVSTTMEDPAVYDNPSSFFDGLLFFVKGGHKHTFVLHREGDYCCRFGFEILQGFLHLDFSARIFSPPKKNET